MALTLEQVRHVATLARLALTPEEEERYRHQLSAILDAMEALKAVDTSKVEPTSHATLGASTGVPLGMRPDEPRPSLDEERALRNAPAKSGTSFAVPKIIE
jgi:aspartyl-tRNA(Asn)/glutamyl-tRNA(Gln) amidotransferase subunit C